MTTQQKQQQSQPQQYKASDFQTLDLIGRGTFGTVRRVVHKPTQKIYVRKEISYLAMNNKEKHQLNAEFRILRDLKHANIVEYLHHEHIQDQHMVHLYMEYCGGGDLSKVIRSHKERGQLVKEGVVWRVFTQVLLALYRCHYGRDCDTVTELFISTPELGGDNNSSPINSNTVIHRDIKPDNIFLLDDSYSIKLGDFGLAKCLKHENEFAQTYVGTPYYMSPEVLMDRPYDPVCDVWSLGCVMYELCSLRPPFQAKTHLSLQEKIKLGEFEPIPDHYSHRLKMCINACLIVDPNERATVNQLLQDSSFKMFRKEWELKHHENNLVDFEKSLISKERKLMKAEENLVEECKMMNLKFEEIRSSYKKEFNYMLDLQLTKILNEMVGPQQSQLIMKQYQSANGGIRNASPPAVLAKENITYTSNFQQQQQNKIRGPRELNDYTNRMRASPGRRG